MEKENKKLSLKKNGPIWIIWNLIESMLLIAMGVLTIINCKDESLQANLFIILSWFLIVGGALRIIANFVPVFIAKNSDDNNKLFIRVNMSYSMSVTGAIELALGIASLVSMTGDAATGIVTFITNIIVYFVSILFIVGGAALIIFAVAFIITKLYKLYVSIIEIVFGLATAGLGVVALIEFGKPEVKQTIITILLIVVGALIILAGILEAAFTFKSMIKDKKKKEVKVVKEDAVVDAPKAENIPQEENVEELSVSQEEEPLEIELKE